ncbi:g2944 [Coccomyxa elongata]
MVEVKKGVIEKLVVFTVAIAIIPLSILYASLYGYLDPLIAVIFGHVTSNLRQMFGAILAVLAVNMVLVAYVVSAYKEEPEKQD